MFRRSILRALVVALLATLLCAPSAAAWSHHKGGHAPSTEPSGCTPPAGSFLVGTHNVLHGSAFFTRFADIIGWQEVTRSTHRSKMKHQLGTGFRHYVPRNDSAAAVPLSWRDSRFTFHDGRSVKTHEGRLGVSPDRWINIVRLRKRGTGQTVVVVNTHFISEAFNEGSSYRTWRLSRWYQHRDVLLRELNRVRYYNPQASIYVVGDFNHRGYLDLSSNRIYPLRYGSSTPIDQLYAGLPGRGGCVQKLTTMGSDHNRWRAAAWIGR